MFTRDRHVEKRSSEATVARRTGVPDHDPARLGDGIPRSEGSAATVLLCICIFTYSGMVESSLLWNRSLKASVPRLPCTID